jgi:hypothetical protein
LGVAGASRFDWIGRFDCLHDYTKGRGTRNDSATRLQIFDRLKTLAFGPQTIEMRAARDSRIVDVCFALHNGPWSDMAALPGCAMKRHARAISAPDF